MGYCRQTALPTIEPVSLAQMRAFLRLPASYTSDDSTLLLLIQAAREAGEGPSGRALAQRTFRMVLDSHPYYTDTIQSQQAYPASYYSLPRYSTTLWNYSQMIKLPYPPLVSVQGMRSVNADGTIRTMRPDVDFILDRISEPPRIFPLPGQYWPPDLYVANALEIDFVAGYDPDPTAVDTHTVLASPPGQQPDSTIVTGIPQMMVLGILNLAAYWWNNRGQMGIVPDNILQIFLQNQVADWAPTRG
jgi:hypothetical protein